MHDFNISKRIAKHTKSGNSIKEFGANTILFNLGFDIAKYGVVDDGVHTFSKTVLNKLYNFADVKAFFAAGYL